MNPVERILAVSIQVQCPRPKGILWASRYPGRQVRIAPAHVGRGCPVRPPCAPSHDGFAVPSLSISPDGDAEPDGAASLLYVVEETFLLVDKDRTRWLAPRICDHLTMEPCWNERLVHQRYVKWLIGDSADVPVPFGGLTTAGQGKKRYHPPEQGSSVEKICHEVPSGSALCAGIRVPVRSWLPAGSAAKASVSHAPLPLSNLPGSGRRNWGRKALILHRKPNPMNPAANEVALEPGREGRYILDGAGLERVDQIVQSTRPQSRNSWSSRPGAAGLKPRRCFSGCLRTLAIRPV